MHPRPEGEHPACVLAVGEAGPRAPCPTAAQRSVRPVLQRIAGRVSEERRRYDIGRIRSLERICVPPPSRPPPLRVSCGEFCFTNVVKELDTEEWSHGRKFRCAKS